MSRSCLDKVQNVILLSCGSFNPVTNMHLRMFDLAKDFLHKTGRYNVVAGIISPVSDGYGKEGLVSAEHRSKMITRALESGVDSSLKASSWIQLSSWESQKAEWTPTKLVMDHFQQVLLDSLAHCTREVQQAKGTTPVQCSVGGRRSSTLDDDNSKPPTKKRKQECSPEVVWLMNRVQAEVKRSGCSSSEQWSVRLLCGADVLLSFARPGLWLPEHMVQICRDYGVVCISRPGSDAEKHIYENDIINPYESNINLVTEWMSNDLSATKIRRAVRRNQSVRYLLPDEVIQYIYQQGLYGAQTAL